jgi:hypothetical protein
MIPSNTTSTCSKGMSLLNTEVSFLDSFILPATDSTQLTCNQGFESTARYRYIVSGSPGLVLFRCVF